MDKPLTDEQLWGVPTMPAVEEKENENYCPYKNIRCSAWGNGCQLKKCIYEDEG